MHIQALGMVLLIGLGISAGLFLFGEKILSSRSVWQNYHQYAHFMWQIALITTLDTFFMCHVTHESACKRFQFLRFYTPLVLIEVCMLGVFMGWTHFSDVVPAGAWQFINEEVPVNLNSVITIMLV